MRAILAGNTDGGLDRMHARPNAIKSASQTIAVGPDDGSMIMLHKPGACGRIGCPLPDVEELLLAPSRVFSRDQAQPCGHIVGRLELASAASGRQQP